MTQKFPNTEIQISEHSIIRWPCLTQKHGQEGATLLTADSVCRYGIWKNCHKGQRFRIPFLPQQLVGRSLSYCWEGHLDPRTANPLGAYAAQMLTPPLQLPCVCDITEISKVTKDNRVEHYGPGRKKIKF